MEAEETLPVEGFANSTSSTRHGEAPRQIGRYTILERVGVGASGVVFAAYDPNLDRRVALKLLNRRSRNPTRLRGMLQEAQALARLSHPNVIAVHDAEVFEDRVYVAMDFIEGGTLQEWLEGLESSDLRWRRVLPVLCGAGRGLAAAHDAGLVHRDFKPHNVLVDEHDVARVVDFGLALERITSISSESEPSGRKPSLAGTPAYIAPEVYDGQPASPASDQFAFCVTAFEALLGYRPFTGDSALTLMTAITQGRLVAGDRGFGIPLRLKTIILRGLEADPADRWASMDALLDALEQDPMARRRRLVWMGGVGATLVGLGAVAGIVGAREDTECEPSIGRLEGIWDADRKAALRSRYAQSKLSFATPMQESIESTLDAYAEAWVQGDLDVCKAQVAGSQTEEVRARRLACLESRRLALAEATTLLTEGDPSLLTRGIRIVDALPQVDQCAQAATLLAGRTAPPDEIVPQMRRIEDELGPLAVQLNAGKYDDVSSRLDQLVEDAKALNYPPTLARVYMLRADATAVTTGAAAHEIEQDLRGAYEAGVAGDDDVVAARAAVALINYYNVENVRFDEGEIWERLATSGADRLERRGLEVATELREDLRLLRGKTLLRKHRHQEAVEILGEAYREREQKYGRAHSRTVDARSWFANALQAAQQFAPAVELYQQNLEILRDRFGEDHPSVGSMANNVGLMLRHANRLEEGRQMLEFSRDNAALHLGTQHPVYRVAASNLAETCYELGDKDCALENYRAAYPQSASEAPVRAGMLNRISKYTAIVYERGEYAEAKRLAEWLRWSSETENRDDFVYDGLLTLGKIELRAGQPDLAVDYFTRAAVARELAPSSLATIDVLLADALFRRAEPGDDTVAHQRLERALQRYGDEPKWAARREALRGWLDDPPQDRNVADTVLQQW